MSAFQLNKLENDTGCQNPAANVTAWELWVLSSLTLKWKYRMQLVDSPTLEMSVEIILPCLPTRCSYFSSPPLTVVHNTRNGQCVLGFYMNEFSMHFTSMQSRGRLLLDQMRCQEVWGSHQFHKNTVGPIISKIGLMCDWFPIGKGIP